MRLKAGPDSYLEYKYVLKANDYMLDFDIQSQGLNKVLNAAKPLNLEWDLKAYSNEKSLTTENRYSEMYYEYEDGKSDWDNLQIKRKSLKRFHISPTSSIFLVSY
jgi:YidC/Oxa1 family membrane protein insertase